MVWLNSDNVKRYNVMAGVGVRVVVMQPDGHPNGDAAILHLARLNLTLQPG